MSDKKETFMVENSMGLVSSVTVEGRDFGPGQLANAQLLLLMRIYGMLEDIQRRLPPQSTGDT